MNMTVRLEHRSLRSITAALAVACVLLSACGKSPDPGTPSDPSSGEAQAAEAGGAKPAASSAEADKGSDKEGVTLTAEEVQKLGVTTQAAQSTEYRAETPGYGAVMEHQLIAQAVADVQTAVATARFSKASLERTMQLHGTPGAVSADLEQTAEQKAAVDSTALMLTQEKLSSTWGMQPPWKTNIGDARVQSLARGALQLVRVTFPLGTLAGVPEELHGGRIGITRAEATTTLRPVWSAPADATIPGRSFFALMPAGTVSEGERLQVWAPTGTPTAGVLIPSAAVVLNAGQYWCYVERKPGAFVRMEIDTSRPVSGGYVVIEGMRAGDKIVLTAVSQLLAKETGSSEEPD